MVMSGGDVGEVISASVEGECGVGGNSASDVGK